MSPRNLTLPQTVRPCSSMTALATALGLSFDVTEFWRVEIVNTETGQRSSIGDFEDRDDALETCWALNGHRDDDEDWPEALCEEQPDVKAQVVGPFETMTVQLGRKGGEA